MNVMRSIWIDSKLLAWPRSRFPDDVIYMCVIIIIGLVVVYMENDERYSSSMTLAYMDPIWMCDRSMLRVFYANVEYFIESYDVLSLYLVYRS